MNKYSYIIDNRMREIEKEYLRNNALDLIELEKQECVYEEIASHPDIFFSKIGNTIVVENSLFNKYYNLSDINILQGNSKLKSSYPYDIKYNVCIIGRRAIHNFDFTDIIVKQEIEREKYELININQGYSKCSICVLNSNACITGDRGVYNKLSKIGIDVLLIETSNIKLLKNNNYSNMYGFIGGATAIINNNLVIFGDIDNLIDRDKIINFTNKYGLKIKDFKNLDIIDYGGIIEI